MSDAKMLNKQVNLIRFSGLCLAISCGLLALQTKSDISVLGHSPDPEDQPYTQTIKIKSSAQMPNATRLSIGGAKVELSEGATFTFTTNDKGIGSIPLSLEKAKVKSEAALRFSLLHDMDRERVAWNGSNVVMTGLQPTATYKMSAGLWLWSMSTPWENPQAPGPFIVFTRKSSSIVDCASACVVGLGLPSLVSLETGPLWKRAEVEVLSRTLAFSPMLLALLGLLWRPFLRPSLRKALVALGADTTLPMRVELPQIKTKKSYGDFPGS